MPLAPSDMFTRHGSPIKGLQSAVYWLALPYRTHLSHLKRLKYLARKGRLHPAELFRLRGNGTPEQPGKLVRYLFDLPSRKEMPFLRTTSARRALRNACAEAGL